MTDPTNENIFEQLQRLCQDATDGRTFGEVDGYFELVRPDEADELEPLGLAARIDQTDQQVYLVLKVHVDPAVLGAERVDADQVIQAAVDCLNPFFDDEETEFLVTDFECYGDPDADDILRLLGDEDLDSETPVPVELFAVQMSPSVTLKTMGNDDLRSLVLSAPLELMVLPGGDE